MPAPLFERGVAAARAGLRSPDAALALKGGLAAVAAWWVGSVALPPPIDAYPSYAVVGVLSVMYLALTDSVQESARVVGAISLGILVAALGYALAPHTVFAVGGAVSVGMLLAKLPFLSGQEAWVPTAAVFVLTVHNGEPEAYGIAYIAQVVVGAVVGLAVNAVVLPSLGLHGLERETERLRRLVERQLRAIGDSLRADRPPEPQEWREQLFDLSPPREALRRAGVHAQRSRIGNLRARRGRWRAQQAESARVAESLERVAWLVENLSITLFEFQQRAHPALDASMASAMSEAASAVADVVAAGGAVDADSDLARTAERRVDDVRDRAVQNSMSTEDARIALAAALDLRRCLRTQLRRPVQ